MNLQTLLVAIDEYAGARERLGYSGADDGEAEALTGLLYAEERLAEAIENTASVPTTGVRAAIKELRS